jgi:glycosyltransferase involved in cell wall biosynthesis
MQTTMPVSVIIPAHNEQRVLDRCLRALTAGAEPGELELIVICNGCSDQTASVARRWPQITVLELEIASKPAALNAGDTVATRFPRFYVDADVELPVDALRATARALADGLALCASPAPHFELSGRPNMIRSYYQTWERLPYLRGQMVGTGVYALSRDGRARFGDFPNLTADDQFVMQQFSDHERMCIRSHCFTVHTPLRLRGLLQMRTRAYRGIRELRRLGLSRHAAPQGSGKALAVLACRREHLRDVASYFGISLTAKMIARLSRGRRWERDDTARLAAG